MSVAPVSGARAGVQQAMPVVSRLYIVAGERHANDPLDVVAAATAALTIQYGDVRWVTPESDISLRSLRRGLRPGRDRVLFDFTRPSTALWAAETARVSPGAILCGARRLPLQATADTSLRRARRRYSGLLRDYFTRERLAALDVDIPAAGVRLRRPAFDVFAALKKTAPDYACAVICASDGAEEAYGALRGWQASREQGAIAKSARMVLSVASPEDAATVHRFCRFLGSSAANMNVEIARRAHRADLATIASRSAMLVDLDRFSWTGKTEALAAAEAAAIPHLRITSFLSEIAERLQAALAAPPALPVMQPPDLAEFAADLVRFIEVSQRAAIAQNTRVGAVA